MHRILTTLVFATFLTAGLVLAGCHKNEGAEKKPDAGTKTVADASKNTPAKTTGDPVASEPKSFIDPNISAMEESQAGGTKVALNPENTTIKFEASKLKPPTTHLGGFKAMTGTATLSGADLVTLKLDVDIDVNSIYTDADGLTKHLKSADFFDVAKNPKAKFVSSKVEKEGADYKVSGKLTMHGVTKDVAFPAKMDLKGGEVNMSGNLKINRHDWNISYGKGNIIDDVSLSVGFKAKTGS